MLAHGELVLFVDTCQETENKSTFLSLRVENIKSNLNARKKPLQLVLESSCKVFVVVYHLHTG